MALAPTVIHGKNGLFLYGTYHLPMTSWKITLEAETGKIKHSEMATDADGNAWPLNLVGFCSGHGTVDVLFDAAVIPTAAAQSIRPGLVGTGHFKYSSAITLDISVTIKSVDGDVDVSRETPSTLSITFETNGSPTYWA
jgi:hypothetical protein